MTPQELKNSILQLAIQGKLVEQRPEEGTAEELYQQIQAEKQLLVQEGKIKKGKSFPQITDGEEPYHIPKNWKWVRHNDLYEIVGGSQPPKSHFRPVPQEGYIRLYQIRDYGKNPIPTYVPTAEVTKFSEKDDILLARYGASVGKVFWAEEGAYNVAMARVVPLYQLYRYNKTLRQYMYYYYAAPLYQNLVKANSRSAQQGFNKEDLSNLLIPIPPLSEQKRIVAKIEELLPYIDRYEQAWTRLEELNKRFPSDLQKSILQWAIQGKLVEQREEEGTAEELYRRIQEEKQRLVKEGKIKKEKPLPEIAENEVPFEIPGSWKWVRLGTIGFTHIGLTYSPKDISGNGTIVLRSSNIQNGKIDYQDIVQVNMDIPENKMCHIGDVLICARNGSKRLVGKAAIIDREGMSFGAFMAIFRSPCNDYVLQVINSAYFRNSLLGDTGTTTINQITQDMLKNTLVPLPPLAEQKRIVGKLEELMSLCERLK